MYFSFTHTYANNAFLFLVTLTKTTQILQAMSHITDLIGIVRGLRQVIEAGVKLQQENSRIIWNNSSVRSVIQNCPTNPFTNIKPSSDVSKDILERALVVAHGFRQYATLHVPNLSTTVDKEPAMDPKLQEEIEQLNKEFDKTFEALETSQVERPIVTSQTLDETIFVPLDKLGMQAEGARLHRSEEMDLNKPPTSFPSSEEIPPKMKTSATVDTLIPPKPVAKKKIKVSVRFLP